MDRWINDDAFEVYIGCKDLRVIDSWVAMVFSLRSGQQAPCRVCLAAKDISEHSRGICLVILVVCCLPIICTSFGKLRFHEDGYKGKRTYSWRPLPFSA